MYCQIRMRELLLLAIYLRKVRVILENPIYYSGLSTMQKFNVAWNGNSITSTTILLLHGKCAPLHDRNSITTKYI